MSGFFCYSCLTAGHLGILIAVAPYIFPRQYLVPHACSRVAAINVIQVIAVAAEGITEFRLARQLNGGAAGNKEKVVRRASLNTIPHLLLVIMVTRISRMLGIAAVSPCLHPAYLRLGLISSDGIDEHRQPGLVGSTNAGVMARLLKRDVIVFAIPERLAEGDSIFDETRVGVRTNAMGIGSGVTHQKICVLRQGTTAIIEVVDLHFDAFSIT